MEEPQTVIKPASKRYLLWRILFLGIVLALAWPFLVSIFVSNWYASQTFNRIADLPSIPTALVLGASVHRDGTTSDILTDRLTTASDLYNAGKVQKLLLSGSNQSVDYNEPAAMKKLAIQLGVPESAILIDNDGHRTYDSCWRAKHIFKLNQVVIITQSFHLPRALLLCNTLGLESVGLIADHPRYQFLDWAYLKTRDIFSLNLALLDLFVKPPHPSENQAP